MRHLILARNYPMFQRLMEHLQQSGASLTNMPVEVRMARQLRGLRDIVLHVVEDWEAGFTAAEYREIHRAIQVATEGVARCTLVHYDSEGRPKITAALNARNQLARYRSHKIVRAGQIQSVERIEALGQFFLRITTVGGVVLEENSRPWLDRLPSQMLGGYYVVYADGYSSWSPAEAFESGNTLIQEAEPQPFAAPVTELAGTEGGQNEPLSVVSGVVYVQVGVSIQPGNTIEVLYSKEGMPKPYHVQVLTVELEGVALLVTLEGLEVANPTGAIYRAKRLGLDEYELMRD